MQRKRMASLTISANKCQSGFGVTTRHQKVRMFDSFASHLFVSVLNRSRAE